MSIDNEFNAFSDGVAPGGLRNTTHIKILITFLVHTISEPMKASMIIEALQTHELANYFETTQALDDLLESGNLSTADELIYTTPKGALSVDELAKELPASVKETALADALNLLLLEKRESENTVDIRKTEKGYYVTFRVVYKDDPLMELSVYAADFEQAEQLKHSFLKNPSHIYSTVVASLFV
ncbi:MAG: DUF4364 family protein [Clostridia bacterium]|nr:DUF4364 family protein [Clostridia bacterium]